jgi:hypothetical protein
VGGLPGHKRRLSAQLRWVVGKACQAGELWQDDRDKPLLIRLFRAEDLARSSVGGCGCRESGDGLSADDGGQLTADEAKGLEQAVSLRLRDTLTASR